MKKFLKKLIIFLFLLFNIILLLLKLYLIMNKKSNLIGKKSFPSNTLESAINLVKFGNND